MPKPLRRYLPPEGIVLLAFTKEGPVGRIRLSGRNLRACLILTLILGAVAMGLVTAGVRELVDRQRLSVIEAENQVLRMGMQEQEARVKELTVEVQQVRGIETTLRTLSGFTPNTDPLVATGQGVTPRLPTASP